MDSSNEDKKKPVSTREAKVISFIDRRIEKLREAYLTGNLDMQERIDRLVSSERAMERLMQDLNMNEQNKERIRKLRSDMKEEKE